MKENVNPAVVAAVIVLLVAVAGFAIWKAGEPGREAYAKPPGMPPKVAAEMARRMGSMNGSTAPSRSSGTVAPPGFGNMSGGMSAPPGAAPAH